MGRGTRGSVQPLSRIVHSRYPHSPPSLAAPATALLCCKILYNVVKFFSIPHPSPPPQKYRLILVPSLSLSSLPVPAPLTPGFLPPGPSTDWERLRPVWTYFLSCGKGDRVGSKLSAFLYHLMPVYTLFLLAPLLCAFSIASYCPMLYNFFHISIDSHHLEYPSSRPPLPQFPYIYRPPPPDSLHFLHRLSTGHPSC